MKDATSAEKQGSERKRLVIAGASGSIGTALCRHLAEEYDIVADWYKEDIDFFGFSFDGGATKNIWTPS